MWDVTVLWVDPDAVNEDTGISAPKAIVATSRHTDPEPSVVIEEAQQNAPGDDMYPVQMVLVRRETTSDDASFVWKRLGWADASTTLVGVNEIAVMFDSSKQWAQQHTKRREFPPPVAVLACGPVWDRGAVEVYIKTTFASRSMKGNRS